jgi:hypothetical protein
VAAEVAAAQPDGAAGWWIKPIQYIGARPVVTGSFDPYFDAHKKNSRCRPLLDSSSWLQPVLKATTPNSNPPYIIQQSFHQGLIQQGIFNKRDGLGVVAEQRGKRFRQYSSYLKCSVVSIAVTIPAVQNFGFIITLLFTSVPLRIVRRIQLGKLVQVGKTIACFLF